MNTTRKQAHHQIVIVGGGAAGITVAASLLRKDKSLDIAIIEPSEDHYYQPAFTFVGGGAYKLAKTKRPEVKCIPKGAKWIKSAVAEFAPEHNALTLNDGKQINYDYLVVCPGIQLDWQKIEGLEATLGRTAEDHVSGGGPFRQARTRQINASQLLSAGRGDVRRASIRQAARKSGGALWDRG